MQLDQQIIQAIFEPVVRPQETEVDNSVLDEIDKRDEEKAKRGICDKQKNLTKHCRPSEYYQDMYIQIEEG